MHDSKSGEQVKNNIMEYYYSSIWGQERDKKSLSSKKQIDMDEDIDCVARWEDWGFFIDNNIRQCFVWHLRCHTKINLPPFRHFHDWTTKLQKCVVSPSTHVYFPSDDEYLCNVSLFVDEEPPYCLICGPPDYKKWVKVTLTLADDDSRLLDAVTFCNGEKICTLFRNGRLDIIQMTPEITTCLSPLTFRAPTDAAAMYRDRQLVSWQHQLFFVQRKLGSPSIFEVWEADFETKQFNRLFNLDGFIIFLCQGCATAASSSLPQEKEHVYFTQGIDQSTLYAFNIADQSFSITKQFRVFCPDNSFPLFAR